MKTKENEYKGIQKTYILLWIQKGYALECYITDSFWTIECLLMKTKENEYKGLHTWDVLDWF